MAEDSVTQPETSSWETSYSLDSAARSIDALLNGAGTGEKPKEPEAPIASKESEPSAPAQASEAETPDEPEAQAIEETPAPVAQEKPVSKAADMSPDIEQRLAQAETRAREAEAAKNQYVNALNTLVPQLQRAVAGEFADIKSFEDLQRVAEQDPARYNRFVIANARLQQAQQAQQQAQNEANEQAKTAHQAWQNTEKAKLDKLLPELTDPNKGPVLAKKIQDYALKNGYTAEALSRASANDFAMLNKAMQADSLQAQIDTAKAKAAKAPPVQTPGTAPRQTTKDEKLSTDYQRLQKTGRLDDAAAYFRNFIN